MSKQFFPNPPVVQGRELGAYDADSLEAVRQAFKNADGCRLGQSWRKAPEPEFRPATVRVGWREDHFMVFAELEDEDIFTRATGHNQRMWELGDTLEMFLQCGDSSRYVEFHVTPANWRLQLGFPDTATLRRAQANNFFDDLLLADGVFQSRTWSEPGQKRWYVHARIPAAAVCGPGATLPGSPWRFSFSRYDSTRGRKEPVLSSSSPHPQPDFHSRAEWGTVNFVRQ